MQKDYHQEDKGRKQILVPLEEMYEEQLVLGKRKLQQQSKINILNFEIWVKKE